MIVFRRILTAPLIFIFFVLILAALLLTQVNDTAANPDFYSDRLRDADVYSYLYDEVLPAALEEAGSDDSPDSPISVSAIEDDLVAAAREIVPPEWLQTRAEAAFDTLIPYFVDNTEGFTYTVQFRDRVETAAEVIKRDILEGPAFDSLYEDSVSYAADEVLDNLDRLPFALTLSKSEVEAALNTALAREWAVSQAGAAVDSVTAYLTRDSDHFTITVELGDLVDGAAAAVTSLFGREETYEYLLDELVTPTIEANVGTTVDLGYGVSLTSDEVEAAVRDVLPYTWVRVRLVEVVDGIAAYVKGEAESIDLTVDLADRKPIALDEIAGLADEKLQAIFESLPLCTLPEFAAYLATLPAGTLPGCRPWGISYEEAKSYLGLDVRALVDAVIGSRIPDRWVFSDADLRAALGAENDDFLDNAREWVMGGWTYTDADLKSDMSGDDLETLEDVREWIEGGYTVTEADLRDAIGDGDLESFDDARRWTATARTWLWALWVVPFAILICIGLLGGRNWRSRLIWMAAVLFFTSLAALIIATVSFATTGEAEIREAIDLARYDGLELVIAGKGEELALDAGGTYVSGVRTKALYMIVSSIAVMAGVVGWTIAEQRRQRQRPEEDAT